MVRNTLMFRCFFVGLCSRALRAYHRFVNAVVYIGIYIFGIIIISASKKQCNIAQLYGNACGAVIPCNFFYSVPS